MRERPRRDIERALLASVCRALGKNDAIVAGIDEVGRGSPAGPVGVGVALIDARTSDSFPALLADSKQLTPRARVGLVEPVRRWVRASAVGYALPSVVDQWGIIQALRWAARAALSQLAVAGFYPDAILLDGSHDWFSASRPEDGDIAQQFELFCRLFRTDSFPGRQFGVPGGDMEHLLPALPVMTVVRGDATCAVVSAASVLAKVARDELMGDLARLYPDYGWDSNEGYASPTHRQAIADRGLTRWHRHSWHVSGAH
ncbi:MAG: ribonuclease HII [Actinomycetaceae bacterium]|nr:ribonuclease HII [Actinomycetaceae bacterium]MDY6082974.1 ribonuclease HII [Actinomycetaceae bacterium]